MHVLLRESEKKYLKIHSNFDIVFQTVADVTVSASSGKCEYAEGLMSTHQK